MTLSLHADDAGAADAAAPPLPTREEFEALLEETLSSFAPIEGRVAMGRVVALDHECAVIDVGMKTEGRVPLREFVEPDEGESPAIQLGDEVEVYVDRLENALGEAGLSREKARREKAWVWLEEAYSDNQIVRGVVESAVKGGFIVNISGAAAFLPRSQAGSRPVRDAAALVGQSMEMQILKMDRRRGNVVVSRRVVLEEVYAVKRAELMKTLQEGMRMRGTVKNVTDYGAFVDLGGMDGLLHVADISWKRVGHPAEALSVGDVVDVLVTRVNHETQRVSLGMKQLAPDPWDGVDARHPTGSRAQGRVTSITEYGAFVEVEPGVEGLVHVSEMSWTKKGVPPGSIVSVSEMVEVMVLNIDLTRRRISLGLKQCNPNPWHDFREATPEGSLVKGEIRSIADFGLFVAVAEGMDGMVHLSDLSWTEPGEQAIKKYTQGQEVEVRVLRVEPERERISLGIKQVGDDPFEDFDDFAVGQVITCTVAEARDNGLDVRVGKHGAPAFIRRADLARGRGGQNPSRFAAGDKVDARITSIDKAARRLSLSVKAQEIVEERDAMQRYGSADSGAVLGDILAPALAARAARGSDDAQETPTAAEGAEGAEGTATSESNEVGNEVAAEVSNEASNEVTEGKEGSNEVTDEA